MDWSQYTDLKLPRLNAGAHFSPEHGLCAMEMVAYIERLPHNDRPTCTCPVIAEFVRITNDRTYDAERQALLPYLPRLVGTVDRDLEPFRAQMAIRLVTAIPRSNSTFLDYAATGLRDGDFRFAAKCAAVAIFPDPLGSIKRHLEVLDGILAIGNPGNFTKPIPVEELAALADTQAAPA